MGNPTTSDPLNRISKYPRRVAHAPAGRDNPAVPSPRLGYAMMPNSLLIFCTPRDVSEEGFFRWVANGEFLATPWTRPAVHKTKILYLEKRRRLECVGQIGFESSLPKKSPVGGVFGSGNKSS